MSYDFNLYRAQFQNHLEVRIATVTASKACGSTIFYTSLTVNPIVKDTGNNQRQTHLRISSMPKI